MNHLHSVIVVSLYIFRCDVIMNVFPAKLSFHPWRNCLGYIIYDNNALRTITLLQVSIFHYLDPLNSILKENCARISFFLQFEKFLLSKKLFSVGFFNFIFSLKNNIRWASASRYIVVLRRFFVKSCEKNT